jgi:hypothetical protein
MLRLAGEKADGWLPSLAYLKPGDLERGNAIIDEAAVAAGRDPREIRRLLNIPPDAAGVDNLLPFVLRDGVSAFILASDDPRAIQAWGEEVAPASGRRPGRNPGMWYAAQKPWRSVVTASPTTRCRPR